MVADLEHWHLDTFVVNFRDLAPGGDDFRFMATFVLNADAKVEEVKVTMIGDFKRIPGLEEPTAEAVENEAEVEVIEEV